MKCLAVKQHSFILALMVLAVTSACNRDKAKPQLGNHLQTAQAEYQRQAAEQQKKQAQAEDEARAQAEAQTQRGVGQLMARHGQVTLKGILVKNNEELKDEFSGVVKTFLQHGKGFDGEVVSDIPEHSRKELSSVPGEKVQSVLGRPVRPGSTLIAGLSACLADVEVDPTCFSSPEEMENGDPNSQKFVTFLCQLGRDFQLQINPAMVERMTVVPASGKSPAGTLIRGQGLSGNNIENVILCGNTQMADLSMITVISQNIVMKNFYYDMNGNYGYGLLEVGANKLFLMGNNRVESKAREGGQVDPPSIHVEVASRIISAPGSVLDIIATGADVSSSNSSDPSAESESQSEPENN